MSKIDDLIQKLCPDGVKHHELSDISVYSTERVDATALDGSTFVGVDNLLPDKAGRSDANYSPNTARLTAFRKGDILIGNIRPYLKKVWLADRSGGCSGDVLAVHLREQYQHELTPRFLYYLLSSDSFFSFDMQHARGAKMPRGDKDEIMKFRVPVPPLAVQKEIVRILDSFTSLEAELEAELEARKKQYEYYRDQLLTFRPSAEREARRLTLAEMEDAQMIKLGRGKVISKRDIENNPGDYPVYSSSAAGIGEFGRYGDYLFDDERITWSIDGGGRFFYRPAERYSVTNVSGWLKVLDQAISTKFLFYELETLWTKKTFDYTKKAHPSVIRREYTIAIPPLEEQQRIVSILDKFDGLVSNLSSGLPAEIAARRQQYEFYRDRLLSFKELAA